MLRVATHRLRIRHPAKTAHGPDRRDARARPSRLIGGPRPASHQSPMPPVSLRSISPANRDGSAVAVRHTSMNEVT